MSCLSCILVLLLAFPFIRRFVRLWLKRNEPTSSFYRGKVIWITGASSGIGEGLCYEFSKAGASIVLSSRNVEKLKLVAKKAESLAIDADNQTFIIARVDLGEEASIEEAWSTISSQVGGVDVLINNGGVSFYGSIQRTKFSTIKFVTDVNYLGAVGATLQVLPGMVAKENGTIVFVNSVKGKLSNPFSIPYTASKHALKGFTTSLRNELHGRGITVANVYPGYVNTNLPNARLGPSGDIIKQVDHRFDNSYTPEYVAKTILRDLAVGETEIVVAQWKVRLVMFLEWLSPAISGPILRKHEKGAYKGVRKDKLN